MATADAFDTHRHDGNLRPSYANIVTDLLHLLENAERRGLRRDRARRWRATLLARQFSPEFLTVCERRLRAWLAKTASPFGGG
jgi:hypothetical protein